MMIEYIVIAFILFIYIMSCIAVAIWHDIVSGTERMSWVGNIEIYLPVYNTVTATQLWREFNPLK